MMDLNKIILASTNNGKKKEFELALKGLPIVLENISDNFNCSEDGNSFFENALQKAQTAARITNSPSLADDSGLCVESLNGRPGLHSARYFGKGEGINKLLEELKNIKNRKAFFVCCLVLVSPTGEVIWHTEEKWQGTIALKVNGEKGFGFDPIFIPIEREEQTAAELEAKDKESISHRGKAIAKFKEFLKIQLLNNQNEAHLTPLSESQTEQTTLSKHF
ncbi:MAG: RdgB/HAM1 family non-canonical purine NTP pyrophosphatase [Candidatus Caenarcaniphilales bacterium]|nr:RdgB/HAM1 family non-canonical purine NTP pyrophosphatase [Candidatus Caenarcaniphilales bacterium]